MINSFILSFKLKNTYRVNSIIYALKHTPILKKVFSYSLYSSKGLKTFANIISALLEFGSIFFGKIIYFLLFYFTLVPLYKNTSLAFINIFIFLTIIGGLINTYLFNPSIDKYYAIYLMRFDSKKYTLSNYYYNLIKCIIGLLPLTIISSIIFKYNIIISLLMPIYVISIKNIFNAYSLSSYKSNEKIKNKNKFVPFLILIVLVLLALGYVPPLFEIGVNNTFFYVLFVCTVLLGTYSFIYIKKFNLYTKMCKDILKQDEYIPNNNVLEEKTYKKQITNEIIKNTDKTGYEYFNFVFVQRHKKLLMKSTKNISIGLIILFIIVNVVCIIFPSKNNEVNDILKNSIPYYLFVMYFINRGQRICQTMFMNCDRSMLTYKFYREKDSLLSLFKERLKTLIKLNIIPGLIIAFGTTIMLYITGGTTITLYIITFLTIISMSIFFSVHYLVLYYLLQPYSVNLDIKNPLFISICGLTYFVCYIASQVQIPTMIFGICMCIFTIIYSILSLYLAYKYAPTNFKLKV